MFADPISAGVVGAFLLLRMAIGLSSRMSFLITLSDIWAAQDYRLWPEGHAALLEDAAHPKACICRGIKAQGGRSFG